MKILYKLILCSLLFYSCDNDDDGNENDVLPPATQIGANTAGCLVDGNVLIPKGSGNIFQCFYQLVDGERYFSISFSDRSGNGVIGCQVVSRMQEIEAGITYDLVMEFQEESGYGASYFQILNFNNIYSTNQMHNGSVTITHLDFLNNTVSGTFFFDAINESGDIKQIRDGRFDAQFTE